jgi:chromosomal replication initiator protein
MVEGEAKEAWSRFLEHAKKNCSSLASFENWLTPIQLVEGSSEKITLEVPNIFVKEYLLNTYKNDMCSFLPLRNPGEPAIDFVIAKRAKAPAVKISQPSAVKEDRSSSAESNYSNNLNQLYTFSNYVEGPSNQFVKSAAMGVASRPGRSYNPLFIHGGVGLGKTHLLHSIGHYIGSRFPQYKIQCITTEAFINDLVGSLRNKSVDKWKNYYRSAVDVLLVDDIQFLQDRPNFEEEFCNTFESLINQNKQIVIASDKPPGQLKLSERMIARMEWGLVANVGIPELETRVAIIQVKSELKGIKIPQDTAFYMAESIQGNVRQIEGAVNRLTAQARLLNQPITQDFIENTLSEMLHHTSTSKVSVEQILKSVAAAFQVKVSELKGTSRTKNIATPRQVAMFLSKELVKNESLAMLGAYFGKTHSTLLHAHKAIQKKLDENKILQRQVEMIKRNIGV